MDQYMHFLRKDIHLWENRFELVKSMPMLVSTVHVQNNSKGNNSLKMSCLGFGSDWMEMTPLHKRSLVPTYVVDLVKWVITHIWIAVISIWLSSKKPMSERCVISSFNKM